MKNRFMTFVLRGLCMGIKNCLLCRTHDRYRERYSAGRTGRKYWSGESLTVKETALELQEPL